MPEDFAAAYRRATGMRLPTDRFAFADTPAKADELAALVAQGRKQATASLLADYDPQQDPLPVTGERSVVLDGHDEPVCVIETTDVELRPFDEVDAAFAYAEGEGDRSLDGWRTEHERFFRERCEALGLDFTGDLEVVCERFTVAWAPAKSRYAERPDESTARSGDG
ncbi:ASCH domain-containing protein [Egicoccus sp. AB-alg2]|uniref:ASCH domain-containing protein n=1 Tax=Egicoccus sp. AB-alg2 TaxID=3242693 RepID=UPI00359EA350